MIRSRDQYTASETRAAEPKAEVPSRLNKTDEDFIWNATDWLVQYFMNKYDTWFHLFFSISRRICSSSSRF